eukprot:scaffold49071_cov54-Attheya_sp.AAC.3
MPNWWERYLSRRLSQVDKQRQWGFSMWEINCEVWANYPSEKVALNEQWNCWDAKNVGGLCD